MFVWPGLEVGSVLVGGGGVMLTPQSAGLWYIVFNVAWTKMIFWIEGGLNDGESVT